jgi:spore maturation protein B
MTPDTSPFLLKLVQTVSDWMIPLIFFLFALLAMTRKVKLYESFVEGGKEGFNVFLRILPYLVAILVAIGMFRASGALYFLTATLDPFTSVLGMPSEVLPVALMRPLSGSGSLGLAAEIINEAPNSYIANVASTVYGSTDTTFYVIALYFGSVGIKKIRHALIAGLIADCAGILAACWICKLVFTQ